MVDWQHLVTIGCRGGVQTFGVSGPHIKYTVTHIIKKKNPHNVLSKFTILCWAAFIAILGCMQPTGRRLDTPARMQGRGRE